MSDNLNVLGNIGRTFTSAILSVNMRMERYESFKQMCSAVPTLGKGNMWESKYMQIVAFCNGYDDAKNNLPGCMQSAMKNPLVRSIDLRMDRIAKNEPGIYEKIIDNGNNPICAGMKLDEVKRSNLVRMRIDVPLTAAVLSTILRLYGSDLEYLDVCLTQEQGTPAPFNGTVSLAKLRHLAITDRSQGSDTGYNTLVNLLSRASKSLTHLCLSFQWKQSNGLFTPASLCIGEVCNFPLLKHILFQLFKQGDAKDNGGGAWSLKQLVENCIDAVTPITKERETEVSLYVDVRGFNVKVGEFQLTKPLSAVKVLIIAYEDQMGTLQIVTVNRAEQTLTQGGDNVNRRPEKWCPEGSLLGETSVPHKKQKTNP